VFVDKVEASFGQLKSVRCGVPTRAFKDKRFGRVNVVVAASDPQGDADLRSAKPVTGRRTFFALDSDLNSWLHKAYGDRLNE
jgi:hypothetical protein